MALRKIFFTFFLLNIVFTNLSYSQQYSDIDSIVLAYPNFGSTQKLAERIKKTLQQNMIKREQFLVGLH